MTARDAIPALNLDLAALRAGIDRQWDADIVPQLIDYVKIPAKSPGFDHEWAKHGYLKQVVDSAKRWVASQGVKGLTLEVLELEGRTPVLYFDIPATGGLPENPTVLFYGHLDKQPEMTGWRDGFGPWIPVIEGGKLYGRGSADDGYAVYAALARR